MSSLRNVPVKTLRERLEDCEYLAMHAQTGADRAKAATQVEAIRKEIALRDAERLARSQRVVRG